MCYGKRTILDGIHLQLDRGERVAVMGPSGCGKTTLLNCVGAIDRPKHGSIRFEDCDLTTLNDNQLNDFRREKLGFIFQFFHLLPTLTVAENIAFPLMLAKSPRVNREKRVNELLDAVDLQQVATRLPGQLSGGEMQRVAIARAMSLKPLLLLADEPTGNLDEETGHKVLRVLSELCDETGTAMLMVTHSREAASICHRTLHLRTGHLTSSHEVG